MNLPAFCIKRPAFTIVISLVLTIIGVIGYLNLPVRWIPNVNYPSVSISTTYPGANARLVENDVTKVLEGSLSGINGISTLESTSRQGQSQISIDFRLGYDMATAVEDVRGAVDRARSKLPKDVQNPIVMKANPEGMPILFLAFYDSARSDQELSDYIDKYVLPSFETIDGVGNVVVYGKRVSAMRVNLDPVKLAGARVTVDEVAQVLQDQNSSIPSGQIRGFDRFYSVVTDTTLKTPAQFNDLILRDDQNQLVRLKDVGTAKLEPEDVDSAFRVNSKPAVALGIIPQSTANPLDVEARLQRVLKEIKQNLPATMKVNIAYNQADYIRASMNSVYEAFIEAVIFVWFVILIFLCSFRATLIPIITIPVCLISTFALLFVMGFSINTITLMAFVLAIGLVVDDAIVMLENISRYIEEGLTPFAAALKGSREIIFPIIAMTITLAAVYTPIAFTPGLLGVLFKEFTFTLAGAVLISGLIALTLSPMMCARLLKTHQQENRYSIWFNEQLTKLQARYKYLLVKILNKRVWIVGFLLFIGLIGFGLYYIMPSELAPAEDMNEIDVFSAAPRSASFQYTNAYVKDLEKIYSSLPEVENYFSIIGGGSASHSFQILNLSNKTKRQRSTEELVKVLSDETSKIPGMRVNVSIPPPALAEFAGSSDGDRIGVVLKTTGDYQRLQYVSSIIMNKLKLNPHFVHVDNRLKWDSEQFQISIDRDRAADLKVSIPTITNTISTLLAGRTIGKSQDANVILQMDRAGLANPNLFQELYVRNTSGAMIPLANLLSVNVTTAPEIFNHYDRLRADIIYISLAPDFKMADAINYLEKTLQDNLPDDIKYAFTGEAKSFQETSGKTSFTFLLALIFIYLVLVAQFESFIDPLIIMFTVPFAIVGAMFTLKIFGGSLNIYSNIGLITLIGLIAKHGILITEFANRIREQGNNIEEAVIEAALLRLRPILMTTAAMILGAFPLAFAFGPGAESRQQIGLVITGGLLFGTIFSLIVVPIVYTFLAPFKKSTKTSVDKEGEYATIL